MKKYALMCMISALIITIGCKKAPETLVDQTQHINQDYYWYGSFNADVDAKLNVDITVTSGSAVDLLLMNQAGFNQFENLFKLDSFADAQSLNPEYYIAYPLDVQTGENVTYSFTSNLSADIYLVNPQNFTLFQNGQTFYPYVSHEGVISAQFTYTAVAAETLYFIIDNSTYWGTPPQGTITYNYLATKPKGTTFTYYASGSALNITAKSYSFTTPATGSYYIVINNSGGIHNGATPKGPVDVDILITAQ